MMSRERALHFKKRPSGQRGETQFTASRRAHTHTHTHGKLFYAREQVGRLTWKGTKDKPAQECTRGSFKERKRAPWGGRNTHEEKEKRLGQRRYLISAFGGLSGAGLTAVITN